MKKFIKISLCFLIVIASVLSFSACDKKPAEPQLKGTAYEDARFQKFEKALIEKGIVYKEVIKRDHAMVGAKEAYAYTFDKNFVVEIYAYEEDSEVFKEAAEVNMIPLLEMGGTIPVKFNGTMCIYFSDWQNEKTDAIFDIFKNIK